MPALFFITSLLLCIRPILLYILRLPNCGKYHANFTQLYDGEYFNGVVGKTVYNATRQECVMQCVFHHGCVFFNQNIDGNYCELLTSHVGNTQKRAGWQIVSTDYTAPTYLGPVCRHVSPSCYVTQYCEDTCNAPGFRCKPLIPSARNVALKKPVKASSATNGRNPSGANDGVGASTWWKSKTAVKSWIVVDLQARYKIAFILLLHTRYVHLEDFDIRIGDQDAPNHGDNDLCKGNLKHQKEYAKAYYCDGGYRTGRYVAVEKTRGPSTHFGMSELVVVSL